MSLTGITPFNWYIFLKDCINWFENCIVGVTKKDHQQRWSFFLFIILTLAKLDKRF